MINNFQILKDNNIFLRTVPANLTYLFQPLVVQGWQNGYKVRSRGDGGEEEGQNGKDSSLAQHK